MANVRFTRVLGPGDTGTDVEEVARALCRGGWGADLRAFMEQKVERRQLWNDQKIAWLQKLDREFDLEEDNTYKRFEHELLEDHFDARGRKRMAEWKPEPPPLIEPKQGWDSLERPLWEPYSEGIRLGFFDLGTYNPASRLPSGRISDHATSVDFATTPSRPAAAFDLGIDPDIGWAHVKARNYVLWLATLPVIEYVILGDKIVDRGEEPRPYTAGGHMNHIHASGNRRS